MKPQTKRIFKRLIQRWFLISCLLVGIVCPALSQEKAYSISIKGSFTISSRLFYNIDARDEISRGQYINLDDIFGFGVDVRKTIKDTRLEVGIALEYLSARESGFVRVSNTRVPIEDGYWTVPVELSGYFVIPFSTETVRMYIGGGGGVYFGERRYTIADERADIVDSKMGIGIHVVTGFEYSLKEWVALRSEIKFRDLQFESTHAFSKSSTMYNGVTVALKQEPTRSRINVDGMLIDVGIVIRF